MTRVLPAEEWPRLAQTGCSLVPMQSAAHRGGVVVVEQDGEPVGTCLVLTAVHADGLWVAPAHRGKSGVLRQLMRGIAEAARAFDVSAVLVSATNPDVAAAIAARGEALPGRLVLWPVERQHG